MHFLLFGTGDYYNRFKKWFPRENVLALLDNSPVMQYTIVDGIKGFAAVGGDKTGL